MRIPLLLLLRKGEGGMGLLGANRRARRRRHPAEGHHSLHGDQAWRLSRDKSLQIKRQEREEMVINDAPAEWRCNLISYFRDN
mmetsp:Transcript_31332/g.93815  ORF Transcript_31332/g.93815 Transcript_31332/m.93815 type:complete len:83 (-) Transcript_31332:111-359(-)